MNEQELFISALDLAPHERAAYLQRATGGDATLCDAVQTLLTLHEEARDFLAVPAFEQLSGERNDLPDLSYLTPSTEPDSLGRLGHYEIHQVLGQGATGTVLSAQDTKLLRHVAIKVLDAAVAAREHFVREARAAAAVRHDNVVTIHSVEDQGPIPYFVMELIRGDTLATVLRKGGVLPLREVLRIAVQLAHGLAAAHQQGLIHRDIKPANILLEDQTGRVKITDFGLASAANESDSHPTGFLAGTPNYMSPEQVAGNSLDPRTDLFSLGCVLYEMCTGKRPFDAPHVVTVLERVATASPQSAVAFNPSLPVTLTTLIDQLLSKEPVRRPASAQAVADTLQQLLDEAVSARNAEVPQAAVPLLGAPLARSATARWRRFAIITLLILMGLALAEAGGLSQLRTLVLRFFSPTGTLVVEVEDPAVQVTIDNTDIVIRGAGTEEIRLKPGNYAVRVAEDGKPVRESIVTVARDGREVVRILKENAADTEKRLASLPLRQSLTGHEAPVISVAFSPDGKLLASGDETGVVRVWDLPSGDLRYTVTVPSGVTHPLTFSPDSQYLVASSSHNDGTIHVWRASSGELDSQLTHHGLGIYELSFSSDGRTLVSAGWDAEIAVWDFETRRPLRTIPSPTGKWIRSAVVSARNQIGVGSDTNVTLLALDGSRAAQWEGASGPLNFSSDGRLIAATVWRAGLVKVWDTESQQLVSSWDAHEGEINAVAFSQHPQVLATVGSDSAVRIWNFARQELLAEAKHDGSVYWLAFSPDGKTLATTGKRDRLIKLWDVSFLESLAASK